MTAAFAAAVAFLVRKGCRVDAAAACQTSRLLNIVSLGPAARTCSSGSCLRKAARRSAVQNSSNVSLRAVEKSQLLSRLCGPHV